MIRRRRKSPRTSLHYEGFKGLIPDYLRELSDSWASVKPLVSVLLLSSTSGKPLVLILSCFCPVHQLNHLLQSCLSLDSVLLLSCLSLASVKPVAAVLLLYIHIHIYTFRPLERTFDGHGFGKLPVHFCDDVSSIYCFIYFSLFFFSFLFID